MAVPYVMKRAGSRHGAAISINLTRFVTEPLSKSKIALILSHTVIRAIIDFFSPLQCFYNIICGVVVTKFKRIYRDS